MADVKIYTKEHCPYCVRAKSLLDRKGVVYEEFDALDRQGRLDPILRGEG